ncbi:PD-(D/E)XK nuclease domain-containing protein [Paenibacillus sp. FSL H3-0333]|uniref:PD-(D/E)XK nuclease domain-containing protein n=1 Tax=Paenibacillus sp. FSL H3-0333 TaxID=2921373 RepID=UPI0030F8AF27
MEQGQAIEKLGEQILKIESLRGLPKRASAPEFNKWQRDTEILITKVFGNETRHSQEFLGISYHVFYYGRSTAVSTHDNAYSDGLNNALVLLQSFIQEINDYGLSISTPTVAETTSYDLILKLCYRFHIIARQLRARHSDRPTLEIEDEYDVQDLFHALLLLDFDDVRPEEWTPSYAGSSSRVDFLLKKEKIIIEIKKTRRGLSAREIGEQLLIDIQRYQSHPDCQMLVCFVYDPEARVANPYGIENDLSREFDGIPVKVIITPKGT